MTANDLSPLILDPPPIGAAVIEISSGMQHIVQDVTDGMVILRTGDGDKVSVGVDVFSQSFFVKGVF